MSLRCCCDGCGQEGAAGETLTPVGRLNPVDYCAPCLATYQQLEAEVSARRTEVVREFEAWLAARAAQADLTLRTLPDS